MSKNDDLKEKKEYVSLFRTLSSLSRNNEFVDVKNEDMPNSKFSKSLADESYFVPSSEMVKRVKQGASAVIGEYDFADGKDNGKSDMLFARRRGLDMAEVTQKLYHSQGEFERSKRDLAVEVVKNLSEKQKKTNSEKVSQSVSVSSSSSGSSE